MVIRKPYAFLIRHFRLIHFLLIIPMFITILCTRSVLDFFDAFVSSGYLTLENNVASIYINPIVYLCLILIIASTITIILLLRSKEKDIKAHLVISIFYIILLLVFIIAPGILTSFETTDIEATTARMFRDTASFLYYIQYGFIILTFIKGLGFDFERFQFIDLLSELDLDNESDSDEIEFKIGVEGYKAKRQIRFLLREFKAYILENKFFVSIILGVVIVILVILLIINIVTGNQTVRVNQIFGLDGFRFKFNKSLLSNIDYNGHVIADGKYYLAVNVYVKNLNDKAVAIDTTDFYLDLGNKNYVYPFLDRSGKFVDYGRPYYGERIPKESECEYLLVYELKESEIRSKYRIRILDSITYKDNEIIPKYKIITLNPTVVDGIEHINNVNLGETANFNTTSLLNSKIRVDSYTLTNRYIYEYDFCVSEEECIPSKKSVTPDAPSSKGEFTLLALNGEFIIDKESSYSKYKLANSNFYADFMEIEYTTGGSTHTSKVTNKTPDVLDGTVILQVPKKVEEATSINLVITVRNTRYIYKLK